MAVLAWWILPALTTLLAICWAAWVRRSPRRRGDWETVREHARFRAALAASAARQPDGSRRPPAAPGSPAAETVGNRGPAPTV